VDHFSVIQSLCRVGLAGETETFRKQVERLAQRLAKAGGEKEAVALRRLLDAPQQVTELAPSRVELSRVIGPGEPLSTSIRPPHDKETSAPLAQIIFDPGSVVENLVLSTELSHAVDAVLEEWKAFEELAAVGVAPSRSCLLFGAPGTGKTLTAMSIAQRMGLPVVLARLDGLISSFLGTTARNIGNLFEFADRYRCVLLLDEFDAIAKLRDDPQEVGEIKRVVNTLLQSLDQRAGRGVTIALTNHPSLLDPAIWRRFEVKIEMPAPGQQERLTLFKRFLAPLTTSDVGFQLLAWATEGATGAEVRGIVNSVKRQAALSGQLADGPELQPKSLIPMLQRYHLTSASGTARPRLEALRCGEKPLARALLGDAIGGFNQSIVAALLGRDQATVSRWMREDA
jgi:hypothetical protein